MKNIQKLGKECVGCTTCQQVCPQNCISFLPDREGFIYPCVNEKLCIECGRCESHCPILSKPLFSKPLYINAAKNIDKNVLKESSSGGVFSILAHIIFSKKGAVVGCAFDENLVAKHVIIEDEDELYRLRKSKYVQSDICGIYSKVRDLLNKDRYVLFSGTSCQVAGLLSFLEKKYEKLVTVDFACHGVSSPALLKNYFEWRGGKMGGKLISFDFRNKEKFGWGTYTKAQSRNCIEYKHSDYDPYYFSFRAGKTLRENCYNCRYKKLERVADITLADFWRVNEIDPQFADKMGVSLVWVNNEKGKQLWEKEMISQMEVIAIDAGDASKCNADLEKNTVRPSCRDTIYDGFDTDLDYYFSVKLKPPVNVKRMITRLLPQKFKKKIKHYIYLIEKRIK